MNSWLLLVGLMACGGADAPADDSSTSVIVPTTPAGGPSPVDLLTDRWHAGLRVKIDYTQDSEPDPEALGLVQDALNDLMAGGQITKPAGIELVLDQELPAGDPDAVHTFEALDAHLDANKGPDEEGEFTVIHALWTDGHYEGDDGGGMVLGFAYAPNQLVMLDDNIERACDNVLGGPLGAGMGESLCEAAEGTVLLHELGHLFGLVNNGLPMVTDHQDTEHGRHDSDDDCLMYWAVERESVVDGIAGAAGLGGPQIKTFDAACKADMEAVQ